MFPGNEKRDAKKKKIKKRKIGILSLKMLNIHLEAQRKRAEVLRNLKQDAVCKVGKDKEVSI